MSTAAREDGLRVLYDGACGFCKVTLAVLLKWDRAARLTPVSIQSADGAELLADMPHADRLASWHLVDAAGTVRSAGAALPVVFAALPGGTPIAAAASRSPRVTSSAYTWVAGHRSVLGRPLGARPRAWSERVIAERHRASRFASSRT